MEITHIEHPRNRFWKVMTAVFKEEELTSIESKKESTGISAITLPSTSPANAAWNLERLVEEWRIIV